MSTQEQASTQGQVLDGYLTTAELGKQIKRTERTLATAKKYLAQQPGNGNGQHLNGGYGKKKPPTLPEPKHLTPEDLNMGKAVRMLQAVGGADLSEWGFAQLRIAGDHLARIKREYAQEVEAEHDVMAEAATS